MKKSANKNKTQIRSAPHQYIKIYIQDSSYIAYSFFFQNLKNKSLHKDLHP